MSSANASAPYIIAPPARSSARKSARPRLPAVDEDSHSKLTRVDFKCESHREITAQKPVQQPEKNKPRRRRHCPPGAAILFHVILRYKYNFYQYYPESSVDIYTVMLFKAFN